MFQPLTRTGVIIQILILTSLLFGFAYQVNSADRNTYYAKDTKAECYGCHENAHPATLGNIHKQSGECLLCHNEGEIPEEIVLKAIKISRSLSGHHRKDASQSAMVLIPAGEFIMGENYVKKAVGPKHKDYLEEYWIDRNDVTNGEYNLFVKQTARKPPKHWIDKRVLLVKKDHPVTFVSWFDAEDYCHWKGKRLPTEKEWEKAARGSDGRIFPWGNEFVKENANVYMLGIGDTTPVGNFEAGKSPYGVYDMAGNVFQWTSDWFKPYPNNPHTDNPNYGESHKVLRGGSFYDCSYYKCGPSFQAFNRIALSPNTVSVSIGFRCARSYTDIRGL
ncbi:MAG: SUMF1/EgtB/PvdO family nonheme iron enzyme [Nitrospirae bacterium]|nr:SUMF1/EgtB/PvdO family nonheme iron enzyme [Nitrospirota bacterium]MBI3593540.1 SUMF1/EgtB/PvdO family nonheme iron enzyme [Nitrospirota bacterium]